MDDRHVVTKATLDAVAEQRAYRHPEQFTCATMAISVLE